MRPPVLLPSTLLSILSFTTRIRCITLDFSAYPTSTQSCLEDAAGISGCSGDTVTEINHCLCANTGDFVTNTATCIGSQGSQILDNVWSLLEESCANTKTPLEVSESAFLTSGTVTKVFSTITTTSAGMLTTFTSVSTSTRSGVAITSASTSAATSTATTSNNDEIVASAKIGAIAASIAGTLFVICVVCLIILLRKRKQDKELLRQAQEAARYGDRYRGPDKPLLNPGEVTPGPAGFGGSGRDRILGANVAPPTPSYAGPISPQVWRSYPQPPSQGTSTSPSELDSDVRSAGQHEELTPGHHTYWPSPLLSQGAGTMGTWCPSPLSAVPSSNVLGMYDGQNSTIGPLSTVSSPLSRQITGTMSTSRSSWAHNRPPDEIYELPGSEIRSPVEADSIPVFRTSGRVSMEISPAPPPEYSAGGWNDPITDKPPTWI